jgi:hypothetical protein
MARYLRNGRAGRKLSAMIRCFWSADHVRRWRSPPFAPCIPASDICDSVHCRLADTIRAHIIALSPLAPLSLGGPRRRDLF